MSECTKTTTSRRQFLKYTGRVAVATAAAAGAIPRVHAAENNTIQIALIGCGGRGAGAAADALSVKNGPIKLVAMGDVFEGRVASSYRNLAKDFADRMDVPEDRRFVGFDAYKKAMDCLKPGDVAIFATPPAFRWVHFTYAIEKGVNVFMEKPVTVDGPTTRKMLKLAEEAAKKNLKVGVGLMVRHCRGRQALKERIESGEIGEIIAMRGYRMARNKSTNAYCPPRKDDMPDVSELLYQVKRFHSFLWASGGVYNDYYIHQIDELSWMKGAWPVEAHALGGRHYRENEVDQNFDAYAVEYTYPDGTKLFYNGRNMIDCEDGFASYVHGTKGSAIVTTASHHPGKVRTFGGQRYEKWRGDRDKASDKLLWGPPEEPNPYQLEWDDLVDAIRQDKPYNEVKRGAEASLTASMGRMSAHTGQVITFDQILNSDHEFAPEVDQLSMTAPAPLIADADGKYPIPMPGVNKTREY
jgi:predicted dehydrogenase